nr:MAG: hypothetical protein [Microvirus sp.]
MYNTPFCRVSNTRYEKVKDTKSATQPGQAMPVKTLVERFATGQALGIAKSPQYIENADFDTPDMRFTDITERDLALEQNASHIASLKGDIDTKVAKYKEKLIKEQLEKERKEQLEKERKELEKTQSAAK